MDPDYVCPRCYGLSRAIDDRRETEIEVDSVKLEVVDEFCNLGDMLGQGEAVQMQSPTDVELLGVSLGNFSQYLHPDTSHSISVTGSSAPVCALLCYMVVRLGGQIKLTCSACAAMIDQ